MLGRKALDTPMDPNLKLGNDPSGELVEKRSYHRLVGKLIYLAHTGPNSTFAISVVS